MNTMFKLFMTSSPMGAYRSAEAPAFKGLDRSVQWIGGRIKALLERGLTDVNVLPHY